MSPSSEDSTPDGLPIPDAVLATFEGAVNAVLKLDPEGAGRLAEIQGRVLQLELSGFGSRVCVVPGESGLLLYGDYDAEPDCIVRGSPAALLGMALSEHREDSVFHGSIEIVGDNRVAQTLGEVFRGLDIDWEELLSRLLGDTLAHRLGSEARATARWATRSGDVLTRDLREYLQEEGRFLPTNEEMSSFLGAVDVLRDDVERLEARVERLVATAEAHDKTGRRG
ncbi:MAG: SCP2 sterol-binding domain-containing protein [Thiohalocapsa sp.]|jgi:ubiquinone biosynthesis protein UbiJ